MILQSELLVELLDAVMRVDPDAVLTQDAMNALIRAADRVVAANQEEETE